MNETILKLHYASIQTIAVARGNFLKFGTHVNGDSRMDSQTYRLFSAFVAIIVSLSVKQEAGLGGGI